MPSALPKELLEVAINSASDAVIVTNESQKIVFFNTQAELLFGYNSHEVITRELNILLPDRLADSHVKQVQDFFGASEDRKLMHERNELEAKKSDGTVFPVEISISKISTDAGKFATAVVRDITKRKLYEQEIKRQTELLQTANDELKRLDRIKNQFLGMATHDLRNPLISIRNGADMLMKDRLSDDQRAKLLKIICNGAESMLLLVSDLLDVNRIESGQLELHRSQFDLPRFLEEIREYHLLTAQRKNISLVLEVDKALSCVNLDHKRVQQVLENLLSNAIKFSAGGTTITIVAAVKGSDIEIIVQDQGVGIPDAEIPKLFGAFQQLSTQATAGEKGTGLGLVIAKKIVELHGGSIKVTSKVGVGSEFAITLPL